MLRSPMMRATSSMSSRGNIPPVGFCGELRMMSLVRSVMSAASSFDVEGEIPFLVQLDGHGRAAHVIDHRLVDGNPGFG